MSVLINKFVVQYMYINSNDHKIDLRALSNYNTSHIQQTFSYETMKAG